MKLLQDASFALGITAHFTQPGAISMPVGPIGLV